MQIMDNSRDLQPLNEYKFATLRTLRECLRTLGSLKHCAKAYNDFTSAAIMLDLSAAMGDDPSRRITVLTDRQKRAITLHLIEDMHVNAVADAMCVQTRVVYLLVNNGLRRLLAYLQDGTVPDGWQQWQLDYVRRNAARPRKEIAEHIGRSDIAVRVLIYRLRKNGEFVESSGRRNTGRRPSLERQSA
jgi:hypothetical protein